MMTDPSQKYQPATIIDNPERIWQTTTHKKTPSIRYLGLKLG